MKTRTIFLLTATVVLGVLIGTGVGILYAPRAGRTTRKELLKKGDQLQEKVKEDVNLAAAQVKDQVENFIPEVQTDTMNIGEKSNNSVSSKSKPKSAKKHVEE
jgi:gas vesicle protein